MRNMSFMLSISPMLERRKKVTRRIGWWFLKEGDIVMAVEKGMGLKKGEKIKRLYPIQVLTTWREPLAQIERYENDVALEGFPDLTPNEFIEMFTQHNNCTPFTMINRIRFEELKP